MVLSQIMRISKDIYKGVNYCTSCGSPMEIYADREGQPRPICSVCGWIYYKNPIPASAMVILNAQKKVLLIKRKFAPCAGKWALPSGYVEINETPSETAVKETLEETGLELEVKEFLGYRVGFSPIYLRIISFGYLMTEPSCAPIAGDDAIDTRFEFLEKCDYVAFESHRYFIKKIVKRVKGDTI